MGHLPGVLKIVWIKSACRAFPPKRFAEGFGHCRVGVEALATSSYAGGKFHRESRGGDHVACVGAENVDAEQAIGLASPITFTNPSVSSMPAGRGLAGKGICRFVMARARRLLLP